jgi:hypothetical protein
LIILYPEKIIKLRRDKKIKPKIKTFPVLKRGDFTLSLSLSLSRFVLHDEHIFIVSWKNKNTK